MTSAKEKIEIRRLKKKKMCGEFRTVFDFHSTLDGNAGNSENGRVIFDFSEKQDILKDDRCVTTLGVYDVISVNGSEKETVAVCARNDFESAMKEIHDMGGLIETGIPIATGKDLEAEAFMDSWVGTFIVNIVEHYDEIKSGRDISPFYGMFNHDVPIVSVGAGPSLDKNVHLLYNFPGIILSTDRAYKMLRARGITPDLVFNVDCHYEHVLEMLDCPGSEDHRLIMNTCADPKIAKTWKGKKFWYLMKHPGVQFMDKVLPALFPKFHSLPCLGNVGNGSVFFAEYMGFGPIVLIGHDYGYTDGKMHAQRFQFSPDGEPMEIEVDHAALLEARSGKVKAGDVVTYAPFLSYRDTLYDLREKRGIDIINCTEGGILTKLPSMPFAKMIEILASKDSKKYAEAREKIRKI